MANIINSAKINNVDYEIADTSIRNILPADGGEIKTKFRIAQKGYANGVTWYYPLVRLPKNDSGNYASCIINGRIGGWTNSDMSSVYALAWNRNGSGVALLDIAAGAGAMSTIWNTCDIVIYDASDETSTIYLKCNSYFTFDIDIELYQSTASILYDGSKLTTTPTGTLSAQASSSVKRLELVGGRLYFAGNQAASADGFNASGTWPINISKNAATATDADKLDSQHGSYYLDYNNLTNKPTLGTQVEYTFVNGILTITPKN